MKEVARWLDANVVSYPTPKTITLSEFAVNWEDLSGSFVLAPDGHRIEERFRFSIAQNGWVQYHPPMFISPLGAPASYGAVDLTDDTAKSITMALRSIFPRLKPMGLDATTGLIIGRRTPLVERINDQEVFDLACEQISRGGFCFTVEQ